MNFLDSRCKSKGFRIKILSVKNTDKPKPNERSAVCGNSGSKRMKGCWKIWKTLSPFAGISFMIKNFKKGLFNNIQAGKDVPKKEEIYWILK